MRNVILAATILIASSASAGEIVWRSPTTGTLTAISETAAPEPEQPVADIYYGSLRVIAGTAVYVMPLGDASGYVFAAIGPLPGGLTLDPATGKIAGRAAVAGNYNVTIRAEKNGSYLDLVMSIIII